MQTQQGANVRIIPVATNVIATQGFLALYNGISASLIRQVDFIRLHLFPSVRIPDLYWVLTRLVIFTQQLTHTTTRFGIYEALKPSDPSRPYPFHMKILTASFSGACGGFVGAPADLVNVRMQNDVKLPVESRRNYRHAVDGLVIWRFQFPF